MSKNVSMKERWTAFCQKAGPVMESVGGVMARIGYVLKRIGVYIYKLRKVFLAIPVALGAWKLASINLEKLPDPVGINLQADGTYALMVPQNVAIFGPIAVTALCLLLMMCSRKTLYPWLISVFSLLLPLLILATNLFPA